MKRGILIYAFGHENYYRMAENLAASLIANGTNEHYIGIAVVCDNKHKIRHPQLFNHLIEIDLNVYAQQGKLVFTDVIIDVYQHSPFEITLKLDADMIWIKDRAIAKLMHELSTHPLVFSSKTAYPVAAQKGLSIWAKESELIETYQFKGHERLYIISAEFFYFTKCKENATLFRAAKQIYQQKKVKGIHFGNGNFTEELAFQIAFMKKGIYPAFETYTPVFNAFIQGTNNIYKYPYELPNYAYSIYGNQIHPFIKQNYNLLAKHYFATLGLSNPYQVEDKRNFLPERFHM